MYVDIVGGGHNKIGRRKPIIQKYFPKEWAQTLKVIEKYGITVTGHNEFSVLHDPIEYAAIKAEEARVAAKQAEEAKVKSEEKKPMGRPPQKKS